MTNPSRDRVEREILISTSIEQAFAALTDPARYPTWGPERVEGKIEPGERPVLDFGPGGGGKVRVYVVAIEPPHYFAYRWMQGEHDPERLLQDPLSGPNTLVEFRLEQSGDEVRVSVVESGISELPGASDQSLEHMGQGWQLMLGGFGRHFSGSPELVDRIENEVVLSVSPERVYEAVTHPETWWAQKVEGRLEPGETATLDFGQFGKWRVEVVAAESPSYFAYRRLADDPEDRSSTLVELRIEPAPGGSRVLQSESGFTALDGDDALLHFRRSQAAWGIVLGMLEQHLSRP